MPAKQPDITMREAVRRLTPRLAGQCWELLTVLIHPRSQDKLVMEYRLDADRCAITNSRLDMLVEEVEGNWAELDGKDEARIASVDRHLTDLAELTR